MGSFLGGIAKTAVGIAPYLSRAMQEGEDRNLNTSLKKAQIASIGTKSTAKKIIFDRDGNPWAQDSDGTISPAPIHDGAQAPAAPTPESPSFTGPSSQDWTASLRRAGPQDAPQQGAPAQATQPPPGVRTLPKFGKAPAPVKLDPNDPTVAANKATAVGTAKAPFVSDANRQKITTDSTMAANRVAINNSPTAISGDSTKKAIAQNIRVTNPLPTKTSASAGRIDPLSPQGITADSTKAVNRALAKPGGITGGMGSGGIGGIARTSGAITEMDRADKYMVPFENDVKAGKVKYDGYDYFKGQIAKMYDEHGITDKALHSTAFANLNKVNPRLANYIRAGEMWALSDGALAGKTSDFRTKMDDFVSSIGPNSGGDGIDFVQGARHARLSEVQRFQPAMRSIADKLAGVTRAPAPAAPGSPFRGDDPGGNVDLGAVDPFQKLIPKKP